MISERLAAAIGRAALHLQEAGRPEQAHELLMALEVDSMPEPAPTAPTEPPKRSKVRTEADRIADRERQARRRASQAMSQAVTGNVTAVTSVTNGVTNSVTSRDASRDRARLQEEEEKRKPSDFRAVVAESEVVEKGEGSSLNARVTPCHAVTNTVTSSVTSSVTGGVTSPLPRAVAIGPAGELAQVWIAATAQPVEASKFEPMVGTLRAASLAQQTPPLTIWKRAVRAFVDDCAGKGKHPRLSWILTQPEWLAPPIKETPPPSRYINREADAQMLRDLAADRQRMKGAANG